MCAFSTSLTTTVFSQRSMWRFETVPHRTIPEGQQSSIFHRALIPPSDCLPTTRFLIRGAPKAHRAPLTPEEKARKNARSAVYRKWMTPEQKAEKALRWKEWREGNNGAAYKAYNKAYQATHKTEAKAYREAHKAE